jgi:predicted ester cyclase
MGSTGTAENTNARTVREFTRIFKNQHDVDGVDHLFAPSFQHHFRMPLAPGLAGFKAIGRAMNDAFPDVKVTEADLIAAGDRVVERSDVAGTHRGAFMGVPPSGRAVRWAEIHIYRLADGKIAEHWVELAMLEIMQQIGAIPGETGPAGSA